PRPPSPPPTIICLPLRRRPSASPFRPSRRTERRGLRSERRLLRRQLELLQLARDLLQEVGLFAIRQEGALEAADDQLLEVVEREAVVLVAQEQLFRNGRVGDQPIVGVDGHAQAVIEIKRQRVRREVGGGGGLDVGRQAAL